MPTTNIYYQTSEQKESFRQLTSKLRIFLAEKLSCRDRKLDPQEITVRLIHSEGNGMIGNVEIEITAFAYSERVTKQDEICLDVRSFIQKEYPQLGDIRVWLVLAELGHSWE